MRRLPKARRQTLSNLLADCEMAKRLDIHRLGEWMDAVMMRIDAEHGGLNGDLMWALGWAMRFPSYLLPTNDNQSDKAEPRSDPGGADC